MEKYNVKELEKEKLKLLTEFPELAEVEQEIQKALKIAGENQINRMTRSFELLLNESKVCSRFIVGDTLIQAMEKLLNQKHILINTNLR